jgi:dCMP deaminase
MLIGLCGGTHTRLHPSPNGSSPILTPTLGICAGKRSVADYLVREHGFYGVSLLGIKGTDGTIKRPTNEDLPFHDLEALLEFVTKRWRERWVIRDIANETVLDALLRRPFFLLVSVDAPVTVRWQRYKARFL